MRFKKTLSDHMNDQYTFARKKLVKVKVLWFYDTLYPQNTTAQAQYWYILWLFQPPFTFAKIATWVMGLWLISTGTFAAVAPEAFSQTTSLVETKVDSAIEKTLQVRVDPSFKNDIAIPLEDEEKLHKEELKRLIKEIKTSRWESASDKIIEDIVEYRILKRALKDLKDSDDDGDDDRKDDKNVRKKRNERREERIEDILQGIKLRGDGSIDDNWRDESDDSEDSGHDVVDWVKLRWDGSVDDNWSDDSNDDEDSSDDAWNDDSRRWRWGDRR